MFKTLRSDLIVLVRSYKGHNLVFYLGCFYIVLTYMRPQTIYPVLDFLPWSQLTILIGLFLLVFEKRFVFNFMHFLLLLLSIQVVVSTHYSVYPDVSKNQITLPFIYLAEVLLISSCVKNKKQLLLLVGVLFICLLKMSLFGTKTWAMRGFSFTNWGIAGPAGFFSNSGELGLLMAMFAVMSISFFKLAKLNKFYLVVMPVTAIMTVMASSSRGGQLALIIGLIYLIFSYRKFSFKNILIVTCTSFIFYTLMPQEQIERFKDIGNDETSTSRLAYWEAGLDMLDKRPWTGVGHFAFANYYSDYYKIDDGTYLSQRLERAHNSFIEIMSTLGYPGILVYVALIVYLLRAIRFKKKNKNYLHEEAMELTRFFRASTIVFVVGSFFMSVAFYPFIYLLLSLKAATINTYKLSLQSE